MSTAAAFTFAKETESPGGQNVDGENVDLQEKCKNHIDIDIITHVRLERLPELLSYTATISECIVSSAFHRAEIGLTLFRIERSGC